MGGAPCGCCYAFGGVAGVEAANALYTGGQLTTLSEQEIVDCDGLDYGCDGGWGGWDGGARVTCALSCCCPPTPPPPYSIQTPALPSPTTTTAGGDFTNVFTWIQENGGIDSDADWPYLARETRCHNKQRKRWVALRGWGEGVGGQWGLWGSLSPPIICCLHGPASWHPAGLSQPPGMPSPSPIPLAIIFP